MAETARCKNRRLKKIRRAERFFQQIVLAPILATFKVLGLKITEGLPSLELYCCSEDSARKQLAGMGEVKVLYHGTPTQQNLESIASSGFRMGSYGMLGGGVYFGYLDKAKDFARGTGAIIECAVALGSMKEANYSGNYYDCDSVHAGASMNIRREEWCVYDTRRIVIMRAFLFHPKVTSPDQSKQRRWSNYWPYASGFSQQIGPSGVSHRKPNDPVVRKILGKQPREGIKPGRVY